MKLSSLIELFDYVIDDDYEDEKGNLIIEEVIFRPSEVLKKIKPAEYKKRFWFYVLDTQGYKLEDIEFDCFF